MSISKKLESKIRRAVKQVSGSISEEDGPLLQELAIICSGHIHCFLPASRTFTRIACGTKALLISYNKLEEKYLVFTFDAQLVEVDKKYITKTGAD